MRYLLLFFILFFSFQKISWSIDIQNDFLIAKPGMLDSRFKETVIFMLYQIMMLMSPSPKKVIQKSSAEIKLERQTQDVKNCVRTLGQGVYKDKSLSWKLNSCNAD